MNDGFQFIDIIFFAMVAAFLVLRLRSVLGRRTGQERPRDMFGRTPNAPSPTSPDNVVDLPERRRTAMADVPDRYAGTPIGAGLNQIRNADPSFNTERFLQGGRSAFEMILSAYARGDVSALRPLLNDEVFGNFQSAIRERQQAGETLETELVGIKSAEITEARLDGRTALVVVRVVSEQVNALRNAKGEVVDGDPTRVGEVIDEWTFARDTRSRDPNWALVATRSPEE